MKTSTSPPEKPFGWTHRHPLQLDFGEVVAVKRGGRHYWPLGTACYAISVEEGAPTNSGGYRHYPYFTDGLDLDTLRIYGRFNLYQDEYEQTGLYVDEEFIKGLHQRLLRKDMGRDGALR